MPFKRKRSPYYYIHKTNLPGFGDSGTHSTRSKRMATARQMERMLDEIAENGLQNPEWYELLRALKRGKIKLDKLFRVYVEDGLDDLKDSLHDPPLTEAVEEYKRVDKGDKTHRGLDQLLEYAPDDARLRWMKNGKHILHACLYWEEKGQKRNSVKRTLYTGASKMCRYFFGDFGRDRIFSQFTYADEDDARDVVLTFRQIRRLMKEAEADPEIQALIAAAVYTSADRGQLLDLTVGAVTFMHESGYFYAVATLPKYKNDERQRGAVLVEPVARLFQPLVAGKRDHERIFTVPEGSFYPRWNDVREAAGLPHVWFKDLRRTFGVRADESGLSLKKLQLIMGHKKRETTIRYTNHQVMLALEDARRVAKQIEAA